MKRGFVVLFLVLHAVQVFAQKKESDATEKRVAEEQSALNAPLPGFTKSERRLLEKHLDKGPVILSPFYYTKIRIPSVSVAMKIKASPCTVYKLLAEPSKYPTFMPALDSVELTSVDEVGVAYKWHWKLAIFDLHGTSLMVRTPPRTPKAPYRIEVRNMSGDLGIGRTLWRIYPDGKGGSLVTLSARFDMRDSNFVTSQLAAAGKSISRSITIALSMVSALGMRHAAERKEGIVYKKPKSLPPLRRPSIDANQLASLLTKGDLVFLEMNGDELLQVNILARTGYSEARTRAVMTTPEEFTKSLMKGSTAKVLKHDAQGALFEWAVPVPLMSVGGKMRNYQTPNKEIRFEGVEGALASGRWYFHTHAYPWGEAAIVGWARFDPRESASLVRAVIGGDQHFSHGISSAMQVMLSRSLRTRLRKSTLKVE